MYLVRIVCWKTKLRENRLSPQVPSIELLYYFKIIYFKNKLIDQFKKKKIKGNATRSKKKLGLLIYPSFLLDLETNLLFIFIFINSIPLMATKTSTTEQQTKPGLRKPVLVKVETLKPGTTGHTLVVKVVNANTVKPRNSDFRGSLNHNAKISECLVGDDTATILFTARNAQGRTECFKLLHVFSFILTCLICF